VPRAPERTRAYALRWPRYRRTGCSLRPHTRRALRNHSEATALRQRALSLLHRRVSKKQQQETSCHKPCLIGRAARHPPLLWREMRRLGHDANVLPIAATSRPRARWRARSCGAQRTPRSLSAAVAADFLDRSVLAFNHDGRFHLSCNEPSN